MNVLTTVTVAGLVATVLTCGALVVVAWSGRRITDRRLTRYNLASAVTLPVFAAVSVVATTTDGPSTVRAVLWVAMLILAVTMWVAVARRRRRTTAAMTASGSITDRLDQGEDVPFSVYPITDPLGPPLPVIVYDASPDMPGECYSSVVPAGAAWRLPKDSPWAGRYLLGPPA